MTISFALVSIIIVETGAVGGVIHIQLPIAKWIVGARCKNPINDLYNLNRLFILSIDK